MENKSNPVWAGLSVLGGFIVGLIGVLAGLLAIINEFDYIGAGLCFSTHSALREREWRYAFVMPLAFVMLHIPYGLGSLAGVLSSLLPGTFWRNGDVEG